MTGGSSFSSGDVGKKYQGSGGERAGLGNRAWPATLGPPAASACEPAPASQCPLARDALGVLATLDMEACLRQPCLTFRTPRALLRDPFRHAMRFALGQVLSATGADSEAGLGPGMPAPCGS